MELKFSITPSNEPKSNGRTATTDNDNDATTEDSTTSTTATAPTTDEHDDVTNVEPKYVIDETLNSSNLKTKLSHKSHVNNVNTEWIPNSRFKRQQNSIKKQKLNIVFNYSKIELTVHMTNVLNRGLNFCILPMKLDITQVLVDWKRFERTMIWTEFWHGSEDCINKERIFQIKKNNLPKNHKTPDDLKVYLEAAKWELIDNKNRTKTECNLPSEEVKAIKELIQLQKDRIITIKPCDKGAGIIILDFQEYLRACTDHLNSKQLQTNGESVPYYEKVDSSVVQEAKSKIKLILEEGYDNLIISKEEYEAMDPTDKNPSKFYCTFKVHKNHKEGEAPPERPIISGSGSITENPSLYLEHHLKDIAKKHSTYLQDTPHFLREIEQINMGPKLPENAMLVTLDV